MNFYIWQSSVGANPIKLNEIANIVNLAANQLFVDEGPLLKGIS